MLEIKTIIKLRGIRGELMNRKDGLLRNMEQEEFEVLIEAANRCLQEAKTLFETEILSREAIRTIRRIISVWEDIRRGEITNVATDPYRVIPRWKNFEEKRERSAKDLQEPNY